jgi:hypothetical protein
MSYSSRKDLHTCARKWFFKKVAKVNRDDDLVEDDIHLRLGTAYHSLLEINEEHRRATPNQAHYLATELDLEPEHEGQILAMAWAYSEFFSRLGVNCVAFEHRLLSDSVLGYIDRIYLNPQTREWYIVDHKTAKKMSNGLPERLLRDEQTHSYFSFVDDICESLGLEMEKFSGCCYTVCYKPQYKMKAGETPFDYATRVLPKIKIEQFTFMPDEKFTKQVRGGLEADWMYQQSVKKKSEQDPDWTPPPNFNSCFDYFRPCPYWSRCYGRKYTECVKMIDIRSNGPENPPTQLTPAKSFSDDGAGVDFDIDDLEI